MCPAIALWHSITVAQLKINMESKLQKNYFKAVPEELFEMPFVPFKTIITVHDRPLCAYPKD